MKNILRRLRGVLGSAIAWGSAWFAGGIVLILTMGIIRTARESLWDLWGTFDVWLRVLQFAGATAVVGAVTGGAFAAYIALNFRNRRLEDLSPFRFAVGGGLVAIVVRLLLVSTEVIGAGQNLYGIPLNYLWPGLGVLGLAGAATGFVSLKLAQRALGPGASADELESGSKRLLGQP